MTAAELELDGYLTTAQVAKRAGVRPRTIWRYHSIGAMPKAVGRLGARPLWAESDIDRWLAERQEKSHTGT